MMRTRPNLALFTFAAATALTACERRTPESMAERADAKPPLVAPAKGADAPAEAPAAAR
ncbi:hypothetical protein J2Y58_002233 [Sphingomonas sp. BE138]|uniref:hypothetical protein n=1 Tax=Sphingomonas sp. BE138 TaxID=2817845 RepID=UPI0028630A19|nr:hypothetical protein [Sphingomonas sp. BE138]MDR6788868.1 hypothetical protein [Sphingomonas sp. BE138]